MKLVILPENLAKQVEGKHITYEKLDNFCKTFKTDILCNQMNGGGQMCRNAMSALALIQMLWNELEEVKRERDDLSNALEHR